MKRYETIRGDKEQFLSLTSLYPGEFDLILTQFATQWYKYNRIYTLEGKRRKIKKLYPQKDTRTLPKVEDKLFFLLTYFKQHPLQQFQAFVFGLSQGKVSLWVKILTPLLEKALAILGCLPCRDGSVLKEFVKDLPGAQIINHDVVEQTTPRPVDDQAQKAQYSGKKKLILTKTK
ncbi:MAG: transposase family protein [Bacteroidetes bacterium]|nr:transposase family protein [Bacteroidota bacterium]